MSRWMLVAAVIVLSTAAYAQEPAGKADKEPAPAAAEGADAAKPAVAPLRSVPRRPFEVLQRFFDLKAEQSRVAADMQRQWAAERQDAVATVDRQLDDKYFKRLAASLSEADRAQFEKVYAAVEAYYVSIDAAEHELRAAWKRVTGEDVAWVPKSRMQLLRALPGMNDEERGRIGRSLYRDFYKQQNERANEALEDAGVKMPADHRDGAAMRDYGRKRMVVYQQVREKLEAEFVDKCRATLAPEQRQAYDALVEALDAYDGKKKAADEALSAKLRELVDPSRLDGARPPAGDMTVRPARTH